MGIKNIVTKNTVDLIIIFIILLTMCKLVCAVHLRITCSKWFYFIHSTKEISGNTDYNLQVSSFQVETQGNLQQRYQNYFLHEGGANDLTYLTVIAAKPCYSLLCVNIIINNTLS